MEEGSGVSGVGRRVDRLLLWCLPTQLHAKGGFVWRASDRFGVVKIVVGVFLSVVGFLACSNGDGRTRLVVYSAHGPDMLAWCEREYEKAHPEVDVHTVYLGSAAILGRLRAEKANPQAQVWWGADTTSFSHAAAEGLLVPYRPSFALEGHHA